MKNIARGLFGAIIVIEAIAIMNTPTTPTILSYFAFVTGLVGFAIMIYHSCRE